MLKPTGEHKATNRELFALHLNSAVDLSDKIDISSKFFACFLCWDSRDIEPNLVERVAEILLESGCVYFCTWGEGSEREHDIIDKVSIGKNTEDESVIMTTWHEDESLDDALWFFLNSTLPDDKYIAGCRAGVAISIGSTQEQRARIDFALKFSREFSSKVLEINGDTIWSKKADAILGVGRWLGDLGDRNWALTREQALIALNQLEAEELGILGGDVYEMQGGILRHNYDNWYCNTQHNESDSAFAARSIPKARAYITNYKPGQENEHYFVIVPKR